MLREFGGGLELIENWARNVSRSINWTKRKGTTGKVEPFRKFLEEEKFTFQRKISNVILDHDVPPALVLNLDQIPLSYISHLFLLKGLMTKRNYSDFCSFCYKFLSAYSANLSR